MAALTLPHEDSPTAPWVTVSVGLASFDEQSPSWNEQSGQTRAANLGGYVRADLIRAADLALYAAKHAGRAQAWMLDLDDVDAPALASRVHPASGAKLSAEPA